MGYPIRRHSYLCSAYLSITSAFCHCFCLSGEFYSAQLPKTGLRPFIIVSRGNFLGYPVRRLTYLVSQESYSAYEGPLMCCIPFPKKHRNRPGHNS